MVEYKKIRAIVTGGTGMVGEGILRECLKRDDVEAVLAINRRPCGITHPKLKELILPDFMDVTTIAKVVDGYNACYFCLGLTSLGKTEAEYSRQTYTLTLNFAKILCQVNPFMTFCYVSGKGTDSSQKGSIMWARVKGKTENDLLKLPFDKVFSFRPGFIRPVKGYINTHKFYKYINWLFPLGRKYFPGSFCTLEELSHAMVNAPYYPEKRGLFEGVDIIRLGTIDFTFDDQTDMLPG